MNRAEVVALLTFVATIDRRKVGDADVQAWHLFLQDVDLPDAKDAVVAHYAESADWLMPAHVLNGVKELRAGRRQHQPHEVRALPSGFEGDLGRQVRVARGAATVREVLGPVLEHIAARSADQPAAVSAVEQLRAITAGPGWDTIDGEVAE